MATLPTPIERQGNFTETRAGNGALVTVYDPFTTRANPSAAGQSIRDAFPGNTVPGSLLDPVSRKVLAYVPSPNLPGNPFTRQNNFISNAPRAIDETDLGFRIDHSFSDRQMIFGRVASNKNDLTQPNVFRTVASPGE